MAISRSRTAASCTSAPPSRSPRFSPCSSAVKRRSSSFSSWYARGRRLALQVADLLLDLVAQVLQALRFSRVSPDARLGLLAALLVTGDAGGLLHEGAHVLRARVDDARDHALLDDGVAARAQAGTEEKVGDVLAAAAATVDEVGRTAIARRPGA